MRRIYNVVVLIGIGYGFSQLPNLWRWIAYSIPIFICLIIVTGIIQYRKAAHGTQ